jgi:hypothetical protein
MNNGGGCKRCNGSGTIDVGCINCTLSILPCPNCSVSVAVAPAAPSTTCWWCGAKSTETRSTGFYGLNVTSCLGCRSKHERLVDACVASVRHADERAAALTSDVGEAIRKIHWVREDLTAALSEMEAYRDGKARTEEELESTTKVRDGWMQAAAHWRTDMERVAEAAFAAWPVLAEGVTCDGDARLADALRGALKAAGFTMPDAEGGTRV